MIALLATISAALYGFSDFVAAVAIRRSYNQLVAFYVSFFGGLTGLALGVLFSPFPSLHVVSWGVFSGTCSAILSLALFRGFERGRIGVVAPICAVVGSALPVVLGVALGERPSALAWVGVALGIPATAMVSAIDSSRHDGPAGAADGLVAGVALGGLYLGLQRAGTGYGSWPVALELLVAASILAPVAWRRRDRTGSQFRRALLESGLSGALAAFAGALFLFAAHRDGLALAAVIVSLFPAFTVLPAWLFLHEHLRRIQVAGLALALAAVALIAG